MVSMFIIRKKSTHSLTRKSELDLNDRGGRRWMIDTMHRRASIVIDRRLFWTRWLSSSAVIFLSREIHRPRTGDPWPTDELSEDLLTLCETMMDLDSANPVPSSCGGDRWCSIVSGPQCCLGAVGQVQLWAVLRYVARDCPEQKKVFVLLSLPEYLSATIAVGDRCKQSERWAAREKQQSREQNREQRLTIGHYRWTQTHWLVLSPTSTVDSHLSMISSFALPVIERMNRDDATIKWCSRDIVLRWDFRIGQHWDWRVSCTATDAWFALRYWTIENNPWCRMLSSRIEFPPWRYSTSSVAIHWRGSSMFHQCRHRSPGRVDRWPRIASNSGKWHWSILSSPVRIDSGHSRWSDSRCWRSAVDSSWDQPGYSDRYRRIDRIGQCCSRAEEDFAAMRIVAWPKQHSG